MKRYGYFTLVLIGLLLLTLVPRGAFAAPLRANSLPLNWYSLQYDASISTNNLQAIGLDVQGNGWLASRQGETNAVTMWRIEAGRVNSTAQQFADMQVNAIRLNAAGTAGWAIATSTLTDTQSATTILQYANGKWTNWGGKSLAPGLHPQYQLATDREAHNGWAVGIEYGEEMSVRPALLRLQADRWLDAADTLPEGIIFTSVAADATMKYVWAGGIDTNTGEGALYYFKDGKWNNVSQPVGPYFVNGLAVDDSGNGWAVLGTRDEPANSPQPSGMLRLRADYTWSLVKNTVFAQEDIAIAIAALDSKGKGWAMGNQLGVGDGPPISVMLRLDGDKVEIWQTERDNEPSGQQRQFIYGQPFSLAVNAAAAWAITTEGGLLHFGNLNFAQPALAPIYTFYPSEDVQTYDTGYELRGPFLSYWQKHGGLDQFGFPITPLLLETLGDGKEYVVQYTERARFEYHPENKDPYKVQLGLLGTMLAGGRQSEAAFQPAPPRKTKDNTYFDQTKHNLNTPLAGYWAKYGSLPVFGYPISEAFEEKSATDGKTYLVQYFERNRLEYHPEYKGDPKYQVLLGLLGTEQYKQVYGRDPFPQPEREVSPINTP